MTADSYQDNMEAAMATEATPLSPSLDGMQLREDECSQLKRRRRLIIATVLVIAVVCSMFGLGFLLQRRSTTRKDVVPTERRDFVENSRPERESITMSEQPFFLPVGDHIALPGRHRDRKEDVLALQKMPALRWGILGPGRIAHDFTSALLISGCTVTAVAASHYDGEPTKAVSRARAFAGAFSIPAYYGSYDGLASDPNVDIVYVATTNQNHMEPTMLMLRAGKNVLVEKPTAVTYKEAKSMYEEAKRRGLFLMTNHWTRFFPLVKYLRRTFLESAHDTEGHALRSAPWGTTMRLDYAERAYDLGKVLAMRGDFSFPTPADPSDRFLNRTLGGGVTLDVGCYLVELALLAAYDHRQSHKQLVGDGNVETLKEYLRPDDIVATGHGVYHGVWYPVDVESSFSLRWGGGQDGIFPGCDASKAGGVDMDANNVGAGCLPTNVGGQPLARDGMRSSNRDAVHHEFTMVASFQSSFRRPSSFEVEYTFEHGRILVAGPGNCPSEMTIYEHERPSGPLIREIKVKFPLPRIKNALREYGRPNYPRPEGFVYVIDAIEKCMAEKGVPGREGLPAGSGCFELEENKIEEQLVTVEVTEEVLKKMGYF